MLDGSVTGIDFEKDKLPFTDNSIDTVILCNVLEHMYNYKFLLLEIGRILKPTGTVIGFVPFWVGYHPDPHDYFRYTKESLYKIFTETNFKGIRIKALGKGPITANLNTIILSVPKILRPILYIFYTFMDKLFIHLRPKSVERNPLGFFFKLTLIEEKV